MHRVQKLLSNYGYCSRRKAEVLIKEGRVKVNDKIISIGDQASFDDKIYVDNKLVQPEKKVYIKFHKPLGYVTALSDKHEKTIMELIKIKERIFPVGRLDKDTSGLILLTNDGDFSNKIMHPRYEVKKTYLVGLFKEIEKSKAKSLEKGIMLTDGKTRPCKIKFHNKKLIEIELHEGKNRIVRRMFEALGYKVKTLKRIKIGKYELEKLPLGKFEKIHI